MRQRHLRIAVVALVTLLAVSNALPRTAVAAPLATDWETQASLDTLNAERASTGLAPVRMNASLEQAARAHSSYLGANGFIISHTENPAKPGFTGATPPDRAVAAGYGTNVGEVITAGHDGRVAVVDLLSTVYHRHILLSPDVFELGYGGSGQSVMDIGYNWAGSASAVARYPIPGASGVPLRWDGAETPSPVAGLRGPFGYPITLEFAHAAPAITMDAVHLLGPNGEVATKNENWGGRALSAVPLAPLSPSAMYRVTFEYQAAGAPQTQSWTFSTASGSLGAPRNLWVETGEFGRVIHWQAPQGPAPTAYRIIKCGALCFFYSTLTVNPDQLYWVDPVPSDRTNVIVQSFRGGETASATLYLGPSPAVGAYGSSKWVSQSPYPTLRPGEITELWFAYRNSGTSTWTRGVWGSQANLGLNGDNKAPYRLGMNVDWLWDDRVATTEAATVAPGEVGVFRFRFRAPAVAGVYQFSVRPVIDGLSWLQDEGVFLTVTVR